MKFVMVVFADVLPVTSENSSVTVLVASLRFPLFDGASNGGVFLGFLKLLAQTRKQPTGGVCFSQSALITFKPFLVTLILPGVSAVVSLVSWLRNFTDPPSPTRTKYLS